MKPLFALFCLLLGLQACSVQPEDIRIQSVDKVSVQSLGNKGADLTLEISLENDAPRVIVKHCNLQLYTGGLSTTSFAEISLEEPVMLKKGVNEQVPILLSARIKGGIFGLSAIQNMLVSGNKELFVSGTITFRKSCFVKRIRLEKQSLNNFIDLTKLNKLL